MRVLMAASEAMPYAKTGGLADVAGSLSRALQARGADLRLFMPLYRTVRESFALEDTGVSLSVPVGGTHYSGRVFRHGKYAFFIECDYFYDRDELYGTRQGDYMDNAHRFVFFNLGILEACRLMDFRPDVFHLNDWQTGLLPLYLRSLYHREFPGAATLFTIHNLGYQGIFPVSAMSVTGLDARFFSPEWLEFYGQICFLKAGIVGSDAVSTVSPRYASEILTPAMGHGMDGVLRSRARSLHGILNGLDYDSWNPATDGLIARNYSSDNLSGKAQCKKVLVKEAGLEGGKPLIASIGRLASQKGVDLIIEAAPDLMDRGAAFVILGEGEGRYVEELRVLAARYPENMTIFDSYNEELAHRIYAGADIFLMPSLYEPCGLSQLISLRYGTVPVGRATGGLVDTVRDHNPLDGSGTGFLFADYTADAMYQAVMRALAAWRTEKLWRGIRHAAMAADFSWKSSALRYLELYESISGTGAAVAEAGRA